MGGPGSGNKPREYPQHIVDLARFMYLDAGMTVSEIRVAFPKGYRVQTLIERYVSVRRPAAKREQRGSANHAWKGDSAGYKACHLRVAAERGKPSLCDECGTTEGRFEWANLTGRFHDPADYRRLCVRCHRRFDVARRREGVMPHV